MESNKQLGVQKYWLILFFRAMSPT